MENNHGSLSFHFFGDVWMDDPIFFLDEDKYENLLKYMPLIKGLDKEWRYRPGPQNDWNHDRRFNDFVREETQAWRQRGSKRPDHFLLRPSGSITAPLAHHLLNPTFTVADPKNRETDFASNPTIYLLNKQGFSSRNSFIFDQVCRREETRIYLRLWTKDVQKPHDDYVHDLRQNMSAIVEVCWGEVAWRKVKQQCHLIQFPLWGQYKDVRLYLELEGKKLKRFVFWVHHPQWFFNLKHTNTTAGIPSQAKIQDSGLKLAAELVGVDIKGYFYRNLSRERPYLTIEQCEVCNELRESANEELRKAFPDKAQEEEERQSRFERERKEKNREIQSLLQEMEKRAQEISLKNTSNDYDLNLWGPREQEVKRLVKTWLDASQSIFYSQNSAIISQDTLAEHKPIDPKNPTIADSDLYDLPTKIIHWLQDQDGLKVDGNSMESREELERAFWLLHCHEETLPSRCIKTSTIGELANAVGWKYTDSIARQFKNKNKEKKRGLRDLILPGEPGNVMRRKCSCCEGRVLDDAFPEFAIKKPAYYIVKTTQGKGCGLGCDDGWRDLIPISGWQQHGRGTKKLLDKPPNHRGRKEFDLFLCRSEGELDGLPKTIQTQCMDCGIPKICGYPRWTIEKTPQFVMARQKCKFCQKYRNFMPVDKKWDNLKRNETELVKIWKEVIHENFDPMANPVVRQALFGRTNFRVMTATLRRRSRRQGHQQEQQAQQQREQRRRQERQRKRLLNRR